MTDSPRRDGPEPFGNSYPGYTDPAYASQAPYGPTYQAPPVPAPTEQLPAYSPYGYDPYATNQYGAGGGPPQPPEPEGPKSPRWLWIVAALAILTVIGLVIALVIVNSSQQDTVVAPLPSLPEPTSTRPTPTTSPRPTVPVFPLPTLPSTPSTTGPSTPGTPGATETVVYDVSGDGRAINITYVDTGGVLQTEFNVMLPWTKQVELAEPAQDSASVSIINVGREVSCSISVNGVPVQQRTGAGLTICTAAG
jgi:hypothetical protein